MVLSNRLLSGCHFTTEEAQSTSTMYRCGCATNAVRSILKPKFISDWKGSRRTSGKLGREFPFRWQTTDWPDSSTQVAMARQCERGLKPATTCLAENVDAICSRGL